MTGRSSLAGVCPKCVRTAAKNRQPGPSLLNTKAERPTSRDVPRPPATFKFCFKYRVRCKRCFKVFQTLVESMSTSSKYAQTLAVGDSNTYQAILALAGLILSGFFLSSLPCFVIFAPFWLAPAPRRPPLAPLKHPRALTPKHLPRSPNTRADLAKHFLGPASGSLHRIPAKVGTAHAQRWLYICTGRRPGPSWDCQGSAAGAPGSRLNYDDSGPGGNTGEPAREHRTNIIVL